MKVDGLIRRIAKLEKDVRSGQETRFRLCWKEDHQTEEEAMLAAGITNSDCNNLVVIICKWSSGDEYH